MRKPTASLPVHPPARFTRVHPWAYLPDLRRRRKNAASASPCAWSRSALPGGCVCIRAFRSPGSELEREVTDAELRALSQGGRGHAQCFASPCAGGQARRAGSWGIRRSRVRVWSGPWERLGGGWSRGPRGCSVAASWPLGWPRPAGQGGHRAVQLSESFFQA